MRSAPVTAAVGVLLVGALVVAPGGGGGGLAHAASAAKAAAKPTLRLTFESGPRPGRAVTGAKNTGSGNVSVWVTRSGGGRATVVKGRTGGRAVRLPAYAGTTAPPAAVLVASAARRPALDPGARPFSFGATFRLDRRSSGTAADDGDNLIQRGAYGSAGQYKIQLDHRVPSCRVKGSSGVVFAQAGTKVRPGRWYSVTCNRVARSVSLTVKSFGRGASTRTWRVGGVTGNVPLTGVPLSIGGKLRANGTPAADTDQFNGVVDNVFFRKAR